MRRATRSKEPPVALQIEVKFGRMGNLTINNSARRTITTPVCLSLVLREEPNMMSFADNDNGDGRFDL
jgi:hypothetical protein